MHRPLLKTAAPTPAPDAGRYLALMARDARFDGHFFTGVTSTGIYCRPVCRVRTPKAENCRFFDHAAQAEVAGFRPCLRCRPELAPAPNHALHWTTQDASTMLALQAADLMDRPADTADGAPGIAAIANQLGISDRHLRRIFEAHWGIPPLRYLQTRRLLTAKQLLTDTRLPVAEVAHLSGFASVRRFNAAFVQHYRLQPTALRKPADTPPAVPKPTARPGGEPPPDLASQAAAFNFQAAYRPPFAAQHLLEFFAQRAIAGLEWVDPAKGLIRRSLRLQHQGASLCGWVEAQWAMDQHRVHLRISESLAAALPVVLQRMHAWLDLDADPAALDPLLCADFPGTEGMRVPGTVDGLELAVRAILGQQITVKAARTLTSRLVDHCGTPLPDAPQGLQRCFPDAATLAALSPDTLGNLGIVKQRQQAILSLAHAVQSARLQLQPGGNVAATMAQLQALPGIGAWTAHYIALRALRWPDAFPAGDVALQSALGVRQASNPAVAADARSQRWRPWRGYATVRAWHQLGKEAITHSLSK